jgi:hypothetical protein
LIGCGGRRGFAPWILIGRNGFGDSRIEPRTDFFAVANYNGPQLFDAIALDKSIGPFEILRVLTVVLNKAAHLQKHLLVAIHYAQDISFAYM